jgi:hypothetical protein
MKNLSQDSWSPGEDFNLWTPNYEGPNDHDIRLKDMKKVVKAKCC